MSNGDSKSGSTKKPHYTTKLKDKIKRQDEIIAKLTEQLQGQRPPPEDFHVETSVTEGGVLTPEIVDEAGKANLAETYPNAQPLKSVARGINEQLRTDEQGVVDDLAWITNDTPYVALVSGVSGFTVRPENKTYHPPITRIALKADTEPRKWAANPFDYSDKDPKWEANMRIMKSKFWHYRISKFDAASVWADERWPKPTEAVLDARTFRGWNRPARMGKGKVEPITEFVPLRELVRYLLQKVSDTFLDWDHHKDQFPKTVPNPYRNKLGSVGGKIRPEEEVRVFQDRGDSDYAHPGGY